MAAAEDFRVAVAEVGRAAGAFIASDARPCQSRWSHGDGMTIFGGWGGHERGWPEVGPRLGGAAARFAGGGASRTCDAGLQAGYGSWAISLFLSGFGVLATLCTLALSEARNRSMRTIPATPVPIDAGGMP